MPKFAFNYTFFTHLDSITHIRALFILVLLHSDVHICCFQALFTAMLLIWFLMLLLVSWFSDYHLVQSMLFVYRLTSACFCPPIFVRLNEAVLPAPALRCGKI